MRDSFSPLDLTSTSNFVQVSTASSFVSPTPVLVVSSDNSASQQPEASRVFMFADEPQPQQEQASPPASF